MSDVWAANPGYMAGYNTGWQEGNIRAKEDLEDLEDACIAREAEALDAVHKACFERNMWKARYEALVTAVLKHLHHFKMPVHPMEEVTGGD